MKRLIGRIGAVVAIALTGAAIAAVIWVASTAHGTRWFLESVASPGGSGFSVKKIEGRIIDHLLLTEVRIGLAQQKVELDSIELRWRPLLLLAGTAAVQDFTLNGVRIQDDAPPNNKQPILVWPRMPRIVQLFDGTIARFRVTNLSYRLLQEQPVLLTSLAASLSWQDDHLTISNLKASAPSGRISGSISAGFNRPSLSAELTIDPEQPAAEMDRFSLQVLSNGGKGSEQIVGMVTISGSTGSRKLLELGGEVGMAREAFNLRRLHLTRPGRRGVVTAEGSLAFTPRESVLSLQVKAAGLDLAHELNVPTDLSGTLRFAGTLDSYRGDFTLANQAKGWQAATVAAAYHGTSEGMKLAPFNAGVLDGTLSGNLDIDWRDGFALRGAINGRNLNPARFDPGWKGVANFNADGKLAMAGKKPVTGSVRVTLLESRLHGQALTGDLQADFAGSNLSLNRLALQGKGFDIHAAGELNQRLTLAARISDFSRLVPGSAGALQTDGWVRWRDGHLTGAVTGSGSNLAYAGNRIAAASLSARLEQGTGYPMQIAATFRDVVHGRYLLKTVAVAADGTLQHHTVNASLHSNDSAAQLSLSAGYASGLWKGQITRLAGSDGTGPWNLAAPAPFAVSADKFFLSPLVLTTATAERLEVAADLTLNPLSGQLRAQWTDLNLARANSFLKEGQISGSSRGTVRAGFLSGKQLTLAGSAAAKGIFTDQGRSITIERSLITLDGSEQGMRIGIELSEAAGARFTGSFSSPAPLRMAMPEKGKLTAELSGFDLTLLKPWLPRDTRVEGRISNLSLSAGYDSGLWKGQITRLAGSDGTGPWNLAAPATFAVSADKFFLSPLALATATAERLEVAADLALTPLSGQLSAQWTDLNLARANSFLKEGQISGSSRGTVRVGFLSGKLLSLAGSAAAKGTFTGQGRSMTIEQSLVTLDGSERGMRIDIELKEAAGARFTGSFSSPAPLRMAMPEKGKLTAELSGFDLALLKPWLPRDTRVEGRINNLNLSAGYDSGLWKGQITRLAGSDGTGPWNLAAPATFAVSADKFFLSPLALTTAAAERLEVAADLALNPLSGQLSAQWTDLNLARANSFLKDGQISGISHGTVQAGFLTGKRLTLAGSAAANGTFTGQGHSITIEQSLVTFDGSGKGIRIGMEFREAAGARFIGTFSSPAPLRMVMPERGVLTTEFSGIDLLLLKPWLPPGIRADGRVSGRASGTLLPGQHFDLHGDAALSGGKLHEDRDAGKLNLAFPAATASWRWREEALTGTFSLTMAEYGRAAANFQLPVPARFPVAVNPKGPLRATLTGQLKEHGIISALFPVLVRDSFGELDADLYVTGSWDVPTIGGKLKLAKGGAYLPSAGIRLTDVQLAAHLEKNLILIDSFRAVSGPGHIEGTALITLAGWQITGYHGEINGENFQTVHLPELELLSTPKLTFEGTLQKLKLRGELRLPELRINGAPPREVTTPSGDVILEGRIMPTAKSSPLALDVQIRVLLGDKVFVKVDGIDAQLGGFMDLTMSSLNRITSTGEIKVVKGSFRTYGVNLEIVRGRLYFAGDTIERPTLDFLAQRTIGDIRAGVTVTGTLQNPVTRLYSEPAMPDVDVLAYIVLGHPIGNSGEQADRMSMAAGALLTSSQAEALQDKLKSRLGLSTLAIQGGVGGTTSYMGYKPLQVTPPGAIPATQQPGITETMLTVGKYITPELYVSYGRSLFTGSNQFLLRYDFFKKWQIETQTGSESGVDLFYKLEFE